MESIHIVKPPGKRPSLPPEIQEQIADRYLGLNGCDRETATELAAEFVKHSRTGVLTEDAVRKIARRVMVRRGTP